MYVVDLSAIPVLADAISDSDAFPVNKLYTSLLVYVVVYSACLAIADVISYEGVFLQRTD